MTASKKSRLYLEGIGLFTGLILGAGIFALPYVIYRSGIFWGAVHFSVALFLILVIHFLYGEVAYLTEGRHRFPGYVSMHVGKRAGRLAFFTTLFGYYGTLLAYGILGGIFLNNIFNGILGGIGDFWFSIIFFAFASFLSTLRFEKIGLINFYLTIPLLAFIIYLIASSFDLINISNFTLDYSFSEFWFLPYGVWLFALGGFSVLPEVRDVMKGSSLRDFKKVIVISILIAAVFSWVFALGVFGITGESTSEDALFGLKSFLGYYGILIGSLIGFLAVFTSYLAMTADLKEIFKLDYKISAHSAWVLSIMPPVIGFIAGITHLVFILGIVGAVGLGLSGIFILEMSDRIKNKEAVVSHTRKSFKWIVGLGIVSGAVYEVMNILIQ